MSESDIYRALRRAGFRFTGVEGRYTEFYRPARVPEVVGSVSVKVIENVVVLEQDLEAKT